MTACVLAVLFAFGSCNSPAPQEAAIIPSVKQLEETGGVFVLKSNAVIGVSDTTLFPAARYLAEILSPATGYGLQIIEGDGTINLSLGEVEGKEGAYTLVVDNKKVDIVGDSYKGVIAGISSLRQLFPCEIESSRKVSGVKWAIPTVNIKDSPQYEWRGIMLDVSRHFYTKEEVKQLLDVMALCKMSKFHWHLTDDQGWRIEIKKYPLLTEKGAWRKFNSHDRSCLYRAKQEDNPDMLIPEDKLRIVAGDTLYGGFYTQEDIREVVDYATVRGIDIVPEIDMPGHMLAAVSNYAGVSCFDETGWGSVFSSPVCPGKDSALEFCKNVYGELIDLFPYKYVHIGGDEVEKTNWKKCPDCQKRMRDNKLKTEEELQAWFIHGMEKFFNEKGKEMIGWDEIIEGGLSATATVMWWRSWERTAAYRATAQGNNVIFTPNSNFYLDYDEDANSVPNIYNFNLAAGMSPEQQALIKGVQGNIWCEWIPSLARVQYMAMPRLQAIAELGWSDPARKDLDSFKQRLSKHFERLNVMGVNYRIPNIEGFYAINAFVDEGTVDLSCLDKTAEIHYTTDDSVPTLESPKYEGPFTITESTDFTFCTFRPNGKRGDIFKARYIKGGYSPAAGVTPANQGLKATWHEFRGSKCADIESAPINGTYNVDDVMIPDQVKGNIGLVVKGYFNAPEDDIYTFALLSDDGSVLDIDSERVVDNDNAHGPREIIGQKALSKGYHPIQVLYFDHNGGQLILRVTDGDGNVIPSAGLYAN